MLIETFCWYLWWFVALIDDWFIPIGCLDIEIECTAGSVAISWGTVEQYITVPCSTIKNTVLTIDSCPHVTAIRPYQASVGKPLRGEFRHHGSARKGHLKNQQLLHWLLLSPISTLMVVLCGRAFSKAGYSWCSILAQVCTRFDRSCGLEHQNDPKRVQRQVSHSTPHGPSTMNPLSIRIHSESIVYRVYRIRMYSKSLVRSYRCRYSHCRCKFAPIRWIQASTARLPMRRTTLLNKRRAMKCRKKMEGKKRSWHHSEIASNTLWYIVPVQTAHSIFCQPHFQRHAVET